MKGTKKTEYYMSLRFPVWQPHSSAGTLEAASQLNEDILKFYAVQEHGVDGLVMYN
jgi:hypothetical protein